MIRVLWFLALYSTLLAQNITVFVLNDTLSARGRFRGSLQVEDTNRVAHGNYVRRIPVPKGFFTWTLKAIPSTYKGAKIIGRFSIENEAAAAAPPIQCVLGFIPGIEFNFTLHFVQDQNENFTCVLAH